jgi:hypothetical protein
VGVSGSQVTIEAAVTRVILNLILPAGSPVNPAREAKARARSRESLSVCRRSCRDARLLINQGLAFALTTTWADVLCRFLRINVAREFMSAATAALIRMGTGSAQSD